MLLSVHWEDSYNSRSEDVSFFCHRVFYAAFVCIFIGLARCTARFIVFAWVGTLSIALKIFSLETRQARAFFRLEKRMPKNLRRLFSEQRATISRQPMQKCLLDSCFLAASE